MSDPLLVVHNLRKHYPIQGGVIRRTIGFNRAVENVSFAIAPGETLGLVGESGCGKTTVGKLALKMLEPTGGEITFAGRDLAGVRGAALRELRREMQMVFQDPYNSLNPRFTVRDIIAEPLVIHRTGSAATVDRRVDELLGLVGLERRDGDRYPSEFSGGQRQRIGIARALALNPKLVVCDEPVSALDVSIQAQIINLLLKLQREFGLTYLFIAHNLAVVRHASHRVAVMYLGQMMELAPTEQLYGAPLHPYTQALLSAVPEPVVGSDRQRIVLGGDVPSPIDPPSGCRFRTRCPLAVAVCAAAVPAWRERSPDHWVACHLS